MPALRKSEKGDFGKRLRGELRRKGLSQQTFIDEVGRRGEKISLRTLTNYLTGERSPSEGWIESAAEYLGIQAEWLRSGQGPRVLERDGWRDYPRMELTGPFTRFVGQDGLGRIVGPESTHQRRDLVYSLGLPMRATWPLELFLVEYFEERAWDKEEAERALRHYFRPILPAPAYLDETTIISIAHTLAGVACLIAGRNRNG